MKKIVLVDDSGPFCLLVKQLLSLENYDVEIFSDAISFFKIPSKIPAYDLIIMDINIPGMDGLTALTNLKSDETTKHIPILLLSGDARKTTIIKGMKLGAKDYIIKPIEPVQLIERVNAILQ